MMLTNEIIRIILWGFFYGGCSMGTQGPFPETLVQPGWMLGPNNVMLINPGGSEATRATLNRALKTWQVPDIEL